MLDVHNFISIYRIAIENNNKKKTHTKTRTDQILFGTSNDV